MLKQAGMKSHNPYHPLHNLFYPANQMVEYSVLSFSHFLSIVHISKCLLSFYLNCNQFSSVLLQKRTVVDFSITVLQIFNLNYSAISALSRLAASSACIVASVFLSRLYTRPRPTNWKIPATR